MGKASTMFGKLINQLFINSGNALHVAAIARMQDTTCHLIPDLVTILFHFRSVT